MLYTVFRNANLEPLTGIETHFDQYPDESRAHVYGDYPAATVPVTLGQQRSDYATSFVSQVSGDAEVQLTYRGTALYALAPSTVSEGEEFTLWVYAQGNQLIEPIQYQWFKDEQPFGDPTTSNSITARIFGSGMTVVFRVQATDATGQVSETKKWVNVPANCHNPPCPET